MTYATTHDHAAGCKPQFTAEEHVIEILKGFGRNGSALGHAIAYGKRNRVSREIAAYWWGEGCKEVSGAPF